ncbi:MAG: alpha/beta fold hydrolase [Anaerovibrio sp.]|uniref:alpha/beta hydrolase n=1 Tax=Anaerovibrio sp. TaxID=1872532 RepID=UPI0025D3473F|nr:alpha/beta fold hydrolase [Anaerovibrio sp.]MCR5176508.1 alpha/beta fold hydrolase [Anaerovibrio sp.]
MIIRGGEPFFMKGGDHGILLIHGFTGVPAEMLLLGKYLNSCGYTVLCVRLAGHGTTPMDMSHMTSDDWYSSVCDGYALLSGCCSKISVVGQSMGGLLGLILSANEQVACCCSLAAPIYIHEDKQLYRLPAKELCQDKFWPKKKRIHQDVPEACNASYGEYPMMSIHELLKLIELGKSELPRIKCPLLVVQSHNDHTVRDRSAQYIYERSGSYDKELVWLEESGHLVSIGCDRDKVFDTVAEFIKKHS